MDFIRLLVAIFILMAIFYKAIDHYFLGKVSEKEGNLAVSKIHFNKAKLLGERTFLSNLVSE